MGLLDNYTGIGMSPRPSRQHQDIIKSLLVRISTDDYYCLSEFCVDTKDLNSPAPDVVIYLDRNDRYPIIIIEITTKSEFKKICDKVRKLMTDYSQVEESFVYDYETKYWVRIVDGKSEDTAYSSILNTDLNNFITEADNKISGFDISDNPFL